MKLEEIDELKLERTPDEIWERTLELLEKKTSVAMMQMWIRTMVLVNISESEATFAVRDEVHRSWAVLKKEDIRKELSRVIGREVQLNIIEDEKVFSAGQYARSMSSVAMAPPKQQAARNATAVGAPQFAQVPQTLNTFQQEKRLENSNLNSKYKLETFVVGSNNRFCYSAAMAVADRPGETYNPLFIYGGVGLGKTHIMQAVGHHVMQQNPKAVVLYITCEKFTNDLVNSIRENKMIDFRKRYRQADVLLVDDIHFIEGKESTQEEFFHTFNSLRESGRQIILSSDRPPKEIPKLEERLRSRFEWGLIADIQPPDLETRIAILRKKCDADRMLVSEAVIEYIATAFTNNIRELEGALLRAHAYSNLTGSPLNLQTAANVLQVGGPVSQKPSLTVENIIGAVAAHYRVDTSDLRSAKRSKDLAHARHVAMFMAHDILKMSHSRIGEFFGNRAHSSVIYAIDKTKKDMSENAQLAQAIQQIRRQLGV